MKRRKLPSYMIFQHIGKKPLGLISDIARKSGWNQPLRGRRHYRASSMIRAIILYRIRSLNSLEALSCYLHHNKQARRACGFGKYAPSRSTFSRFLRFLGPKPVETLFYKLVEFMQTSGKVTGRHLAIDSTFVKARTKRKSKDKNSADYKIARNCDFARLGMSPKGFQVGYRVHIATLTHSEIPIAIKIFPGNIHDRKAFQLILRRSLRMLPHPLVVSADKGYSSTKNRKLIQDAGASCVIRPGKTDLMGNSMQHFLPPGMSEKTYWKVYWRRNAVERTFGQVKGYCGLGIPRVTDKDPVKQHVYLSFVCHQLLMLVSDTLNLKKSRFSLFF